MRRDGVGIRRRTVLLGVALAGLLTVTGCTPPGLPPPITPSGPPATPGAPPAAGTVIVGLDGSSGPIPGFNPYSIADFTPGSQAAASLVLPSTFVIAADGTQQLDTDVVDAAEVTSTEPFVVTYTLDREASWSDGTPVTAEDFGYLRDQLLVQPGTVKPAGYRLIDQIRSRNAGKTVEVQFSQPFPDWPTLFSPLLPSHLMKDFPGGWGAALTAEIPISANHYRMTSYDPVTGQIALARNDKYWASQPGPAAVVLRLGDPPDLLAAFVRGDVQALWFAPDGAMAGALEEAVPQDRRVTVPTGASVQLVFNAAGGPTADREMRTAIAAGINQAAVSIDLTDGWLAGGRAVTSQVQLPSQVSPEPVSSEPGRPPIATGDPAVAQAALTAAGYTRSGLYATRDGQVLRMTLGYPSGDPRLTAAAGTIQRQLGSIGIEVDLLPDSAPDLVDVRIATGTVDLALISVPRGISDAASAASQFGCPVDTTPSPEPPPEPSLIPESPVPSTSAAVPTTPVDPGAVDPATGEAAAPRTGNLSGYCEPAVQLNLAAAVSGGVPVDVVDGRLWKDLPVFPLLQQSSVFAVSESLRSVLDAPHQGWAWTGPLSGLSGWPV